MSRTWKRPGDHGRGVGDWRGKGMEYAHNFRPTRHISSFRDYYSGNYGYDDDTRFEYNVPRARFGGLGASPNEDIPSHGRIMPPADNHLRSRSGMRDKELRRKFEKERFYDDDEDLMPQNPPFLDDTKPFVPKSPLFSDPKIAEDEDENEKERQPEDYIFYLMKCRGDKKRVFTHALAVDKKAKNNPEDVSAYVNEQLNSNPNLTSKYGSSIKILKVTLYDDPSKWYKALKANGINPDDVIWAEDRSYGDVKEDVEEIDDMEFEDCVSFDEFRDFVSEYINMLITHDEGKNLGSYSKIMNALKNNGYRYMSNCPCYDFVASKSWPEWEDHWDHFEEIVEEMVDVLNVIYPDVYDGAEAPPITVAQKKILDEDVYQAIHDYLRSKLGNPWGEENEEFETQPGTFEDLEEGVSEYINGIIEYDDRGDTLIDTYEHIEKALNNRGYSYTKYCPCKDLVRCEDISDYRYFYKDFNKEAVEAIKLCMDMLPDVYDGITVDSITPQQEEELIDKIHDMIWDYLQLKFDNPSPAPQENYFRDKNPIRDDRSMEEKGYIDAAEYPYR